MPLRNFFKALTLLPVLAQLALSQSSLASRVLIVYSPTDPNSAAVAAHYQTARGIPNANLCAVAPPTTSADLAYSDYVSVFRDPVRACLNALGPSNILYIVLAYLRPFKVDTTNLVYAVDSFLSDIWDQYTTQFFTIPTAVHRYYAESQSEGNAFVPFQSLANYRATSRAQTIYSVWRLDGATPAIAEAQVDSVIAAEAAGGPISQVNGSPANACIDLDAEPFGLPDSGYTTANWDLYRVSGFLNTANNFNVITDFLETSFGEGSSPLCPNTALYVGWYNYGTYNNAFSWDQGSIGWDLDSCAISDPRGGPCWGTNAIAFGVAVTSGAMAEPYLEGIARPAVMLSLLQGSNVGDAFLRNTRWLKWMILNVGDPLYLPFPGGVPPYNASVPANSLGLFLNQSTFRTYVGGQPLALNLTVSSPAPSGGLTVTLTPDQPGVSFPSSVTIPAGQTSVTVAGSTNNVGAFMDVQVTATAGSMTATNTISVYPLLSGVEFGANPATGGGFVEAVLALNSNAPLGGAVVTLSSDTPGVASVPASVTVPAGVTQVNFYIATTAVGASTTVNITATYAGASDTEQLTIQP